MEPTTPENTSLKRVLQQIMSNGTAVYQYGDEVGKPETSDFNALWKLLDAPATLPPKLLIIWNHTPLDQTLSPVNTSEHVSPLHWAACAVKQCPRTQVCILDLNPALNGSNGLYTHISAIEQGRLPWLRVVQAHDLFGSAKQAVNDVERLTAVIFPVRQGDVGRGKNVTPEKLLEFVSWELTRADATLNRHAIANIIGPLILTGGLTSESPKGHRLALRAVLRSCQLIDASADQVGNLPFLPLENSTTTPVTFHLVDDQAHHGWLSWVQTISAKLVPNSTVQLWENPGDLLEVLEGACQSLAPGAPDLRYGLKLSASGNDMLLLDLRLFSGKSENTEAEFLLRVVELCKTLHNRLSEGGSAWPVFSLEELARVEEWCYQASDQNPSRNYADYATALTLLPRFIALLDMSLPVIVFSSSTLAAIQRAFKDYGNIITEFAKPAYFNAPAKSLRDTNVARFENAVRRAMPLLRVREWLNQVQVTKQLGSGSEMLSKIPEGAVVELYIDESGIGIAFETALAVGGHLVIYPNSASVSALADKLNAAKLIWGIDETNNGLTQGRFFKIPPRDNRAGSEAYDEHLGQLSEMIDALNIHVVAIGLRKTQARRTLLPSGISGLDPAFSDSFYFDMLSDLLECSIFGLLRDIGGKKITLNIHVATKLGVIPEAKKTLASEKHGFKFAYVSDGVARFFSLSSESLVPLVSKVFESHPKSRLLADVQRVKACALADFDTLLQDERARVDLYHRRIAGETGAFPRQIHYLADWLARFCTMKPENVPPVAVDWFKKGFMQNHNTACFLFLEAIRAADRDAWGNALIAARRALNIEEAKPSFSSIVRILYSEIPRWADNLDGASLLQFCNNFEAQR
jgi:hypothetical protein